MKQTIKVWAWVSMLALAGSAWCEENPPALTPERRLEKVEHMLAAMHDQAANRPELLAGPGGFAFQSSDQAYLLRLKGLAQFDGRAYLADNQAPAASTFLLRRARMILEGRLAGKFAFKIMPDFGAGSANLQEAYLGYLWLPELGLQAGRFKVPVGLERLQSSANTAFTETALPSNLTPNFDLGFQLAGELFAGRFAYQAGVFNGVADNGNSDSDSQADKDVAARLFGQPFQTSAWKFLRGLKIGAGWSYGNHTGTVSTSGLPCYKSPGQLTFFSFRADGTNTGTAVADGRLLRIAPQAAYYWGPVGCMAEYTVSQQPVKIGTNRVEVRSEAWQATASYVITGEMAGYGGVIPSRPWDPAKGDWGATEVVGRFHRLAVGSEAFPAFANPAKAAQTARSWGCGLNWYLNKHVKVQADYHQTVYEGGAAGGRNRDNESVLMTRLQWGY